MLMGTLRSRRAAVWAFRSALVLACFGAWMEGAWGRTLLVDGGVLIGLAGMRLAYLKGLEPNGGAAR